MNMNSGTKRVNLNLSQRGPEAGFIQAALLFGIALMTAVLGGFALANRTPTSQTDVEQAKVNASVILKQGSDLRDGIQRFASDNSSDAVKGTAATNNMTFGDTGSGLFNPANRYASPQTMPASAFATTASAVPKAPEARAAGHWYFSRIRTLPGIGDPAAVDPIVLITDLGSKVCDRINAILYGPNATTETLTAGTLANVKDDTGTVTFAAGNTNQPEACVKTTDNKHVYFKVVQEN